MDRERFNQDQKIDPSKLDLAAATQAETFFYWAEQAAQARSKQDRAKLKIELVEARLSLDCRDNPLSFGLTKVTEASVIAAIKGHDDYLQAVVDYQTAREESLLLDVAVQAMEQRKRMIEVLVTLHGQQYFAGPSVPHDLVTAWMDYQQRGLNRVEDLQRERARRRVVT